MQFLSFYTVKTIDFTDGSCEMSRRSDVNSRKPCNITSCGVLPTSRLANHAICSFIESIGNASGPIRRCLFIDYKINPIISWAVLKYVIVAFNGHTLSFLEI